jgi:hypothetical protein
MPTQVSWSSRPPTAESRGIVLRLGYNAVKATLLKCYFCVTRKVKPSDLNQHVAIANHQSGTSFCPYPYQFVRTICKDDFKGIFQLVIGDG